STGGAAGPPATGTPSAGSSTAATSRSCDAFHEGELRLPLLLSGELGGVGDGSPAGEALAEVDRRPAVDERLALEQRDVVRRPERDDGVRVEASERRAGDLRVGAANDRELAWRREVEVERAERPAEGARRSREEVAHKAERSDRRPLELVVAPDPREPQEDEGEHRAPGGRRVVVECLLPRDELLSVRRCEEEAAVSRVGEELDRGEREPPRLLQPAQVAGRDVQLVQPVRDVRVVLEVCGVLRTALAQRPPQRIRAEQLSELNSSL